VASADAAHSLGDVLCQPLGAEPVPIAGFDPGTRGRRGSLAALEVDPRVEMERHWGAVRGWLLGVFRYQGIEEAVAEELALLPGAEELTTLLAVQAAARSGSYDLVVVDCAPTGSALRLVTLPDVARGALRVLLRVQQAITSVVTPLARSVLSVPLPEPEVFRDADRLLYRKLRGLRRFVTDPGTSVRLVVTPERMVIDEAYRAHTDLALFELRCDAIVMNRLLPEAAAREAFFQDWGRVQAERLAEVEMRFAPLPVLRAPLREDEPEGPRSLADHGAEIFSSRAPEAVLCEEAPLRFLSDGEGHALELALPHVDAAQLEVSKLDQDLWIRGGGRRRTLRLPRGLARAEIVGARLEHGTLTVRFAAGTAAG
jgi:arsenite-transporting ATPase